MLSLLRPSVTTRNSLVTSLLMALLLAAPVARATPLEAYGKLPSLEDVALSPGGTRLAFVRTVNDNRILAVHSFVDNKLTGGMRLGTVKLRSLQWADDDHLIVVISQTSAPPIGLIGPTREWYLAQIYDVVTGKLKEVPDLHASDSLRIMNVTWGTIQVRHVSDHTIVFLPGVALSSRSYPVLFRIDLQTGIQRVVRDGNEFTKQWLVDAAGELAVEENYDDKTQRWWLLQHRDGHMQEVASGRESIDIPRLLGFGPEPDTLLMQTIESGDPVWRLLSLRDGTFGPPMAERKTLQAPIEDRRSHRMIGGVYVEDSPQYVFFQRELQHHWNSILNAFEPNRVRLADATADFKKILVLVDGPKYGFDYELVDLSTFRATPVGSVYDEVKYPLEVRRITYTAADGLKIPAYLTIPGEKPVTRLPLIVLPHGGPAVRDSAGFDWWAQALADQGYLVLQPNYRGSELNLEFRSAGYGEWGRKMQTDLSDGVRYLVKEGMVDPARVCIVGGSYGGYAALAGVTLDPGIYRCAVSVAGVSDLKRFVRWSSLSHQAINVRYWDRFMGASSPNDPILDQISPIKHVDAISVPVLLIHGRDDTVVPFEQSSVMLDAMKSAKKEVEMVTLKNEDHWLSRSETRLQMLQATVAFLRAHNPPD
jgi:dipeptidyl aminopeptidase/acylaminoacyl peptidase